MILLLTLLITSFMTRFAFFGWPSAVVFDEVHNGGYINNYATGSFYFDVHPPLAKMIAFFFANIIGTPVGIDFSQIGNILPWSIILLRLMPIILGAALPIIIYFICRHLSFSRLASFMVGMLIVLENSLLVQSRFILFDIMLVFFGFVSILLYLIFIKRGKPLPLVFSAIFAAMAFGIKWTGLAFPLIITMAEIFRRRGAKKIFRIAGIYAGIGLFVYLAVFALHFSLLSKSGPGDVFMTERFQKTLSGNVHENDAIEPKKFFGKTIELNIKMMEANKDLTKPHDYASKWYTWPFMIRSIFYWQGEKSSDGSFYIYLLGNPIIYWLGAVSILFLILKIMKKNLDFPILFIVAGFLANFIPYIFIGRVMFLYHYEVALIFSIMAIGYLVDRGVSEKYKKGSIIAILAVCFISFVYFSPLSYGFLLKDAELQSRMWMSSWR